MAKPETDVNELSFMDRMDIELAMLDEKLAKLNEFVKGDVFKTITPLEQQLLFIQMSTMSTYGATLSTRIGIARGKEND